MVIGTDDKIVLAIVAIIALVCLEGVALVCNKDGALMGVIVAAISSLFGLAIGARVVEKSVARAGSDGSTVKSKF